MSRARLAVVVAVLVVFAAVGAVIIRANQHPGGQDVTFNVIVTGAKNMTPSSLSAHQNDTITVNITSDTDGEVHLHVYDIAFDMKAGQTVSHTFKADKTCGCDIEWESTSKGLGSLTVSP
ncbi:MAG: cupredoxin domain-containing protein [Candidatus Dormibacteraceae bacterium]